MTTVADLSVRILARVAQLERTAEYARGMNRARVNPVDDERNRWTVAGNIDVGWMSARGQLIPVAEARRQHVAEHIAMFDPAFALALCAGVRQLLQGHEPERDMAGRGPVCTSCSEHGENLWPCGHLLTVARMVGVDPDGNADG